METLSQTELLLIFECKAQLLKYMEQELHRTLMRRGISNMTQYTHFLCSAFLFPHSPSSANVFFLCASHESKPYGQMFLACVL